MGNVAKTKPILTKLTVETKKNYSVTLTFLRDAFKFIRNILVKLSNLPKYRAVQKESRNKIVIQTHLEYFRFFSVLLYLNQWMDF